jgi:hypothetical protein
VAGTRGADTCAWKPPGGLSEDFLYVADIELFKTSNQIVYKGKTYNMLSIHVYKCSSRNCLTCNEMISIPLKL